MQGGVVGIHAPANVAAITVSLRRTVRREWMPSLVDSGQRFVGWRLPPLLLWLADEMVNSGSPGHRRFSRNRQLPNQPSPRPWRFFLERHGLVRVKLVLSAQIIPLTPFYLAASWTLGCPYAAALLLWFFLCLDGLGVPLFPSRHGRSSKWHSSWLWRGRHLRYVLLPGSSSSERTRPH